MMQWRKLGPIAGLVLLTGGIMASDSVRAQGCGGSIVCEREYRWREGIEERGRARMNAERERNRQPYELRTRDFSREKYDPEKDPRRHYKRDRHTRR